MSQPSVQLRNRASCATGAGNATVFGPPYLEAREQEPPFVLLTCSPSLLGLLAKIKCRMFLSDVSESSALVRTYVPVCVLFSRFFLAESLAKDIVRLLEKFGSCVSFIFDFFVVFLFRHVRNKIAGRLRAALAHKRTVHLLVEEGMTVDALSIMQSLPDFQPDITGVVPLYGDKCFDFTLANSEAATRLATAGYDYESTVKPLRLLGPKNLHVSIFVCVEFPDDQLLPLLKQYRQLKSEQLRRLYFAEECFRHIERGIRVA